MKYTIELTNKQKAQMDCMMEIVHRYVGFNPKLEPMETTDEYQTGYKVGYNEGLAKQSDPRFVPLQKCPVRLEDCKAYKLGFEDGKKWAIDENAKDHQGYYDNGYNNALKETNHALDVLGNMTETEREEWFEDYASVDEVVRVFTIQRIIESTKVYEEKKKAEEESIKVGDIVIHKDDKIKGVVYSVEDGLVYGTNCYLNPFEWATNLCTKVDHFDEVEQLLDKLRGEE